MMSYEDYVKTKPIATWLMLTNCVVAVAKASYMTVAGSTIAAPSEIFIPVRGQVADDGKGISVLVASRNTEYLSTFSELQKLHTDGEVVAWVTKNRERIFPRRNVSGLVRFGIDMKEKDRTKLAALYHNTTEDFIIIDENKEPNLIASLGFLGAGLLVLGIIVALRSRNQESAADNI